MRTTKGLELIAVERMRDEVSKLWWIPAGRNQLLLV